MASNILSSMDLLTHSYKNDEYHASRKFPCSMSSGRDIKKSTTYTSVPAAANDDFPVAEEYKQYLQSTTDLAESGPPSPLPSVEVASDTKIQCLFAIGFGIACSLACMICGISFWATRTGPPMIDIPKGLPSEALSFIVNIILTQCLEGLAYIHSVSLRWALLRENRLVYNTNIRLLTGSRLSRPNSWYINTISATLLILCYGATSILAVPRVYAEEGTYFGSYLNLVALLALGLALIGQTMLAVWSYRNNLRDCPSWSSNPLNTTLTMLKLQFVQHRKNRCMHSVRDRDTSEERPMLPHTQQPSQWQVSTSVRYANIFIWALAGLAFIWFLTIVLVTRSNMIGIINTVGPQANMTWHYSMDWNPSANPTVNSITYTSYFNAVLFSLDPSERTGSGPSMPFVAALIVGLLFVCAIQGLQTLGLHCAELIINLSRDEDVWRALDSQNKTNATERVLAKPPFLAAMMSWKFLMLTVFKSLLHWLLGQSFQPAFDFDGHAKGNTNVWFTMNYARLFVYVICTIVFASAITYLTRMKPRGPQPATYGHIQTIADVIDDWTLDKNGRFWWGDKGCSEGVRHAGMSSQKKDLGTIQMSALYAGEVNEKALSSAKLSTHVGGRGRS